VIVAGWTIFTWLCTGYYYLRTILSTNSLKKYGKGSWAVVTGCTEGIGLGFARVLAKYNFNIVLISRNPQKLEKVREEITRLHGVDAKVVCCDFSECTQEPLEFFQKIDEEIRDLDVSILINNVGYAGTGRFHTHHVHDELLQMLSVNLWPCVYLTKMFLRRMMNRNLPSGIINLSSTATLTPLPGFAIYGATRGFTNTFTLCTREEVRYTVRHEKLNEIDMMSLQPAWVYSNLTKEQDHNFSFITPEQCAENALSALGKVPYTNGNWKHIIIAIIFRNSPSFLINAMSLKNANYTQERRKT